MSRFRDMGKNGSDELKQESRRGTASAVTLDQPNESGFSRGGPIRIFPGIEVDILHDGQLDLADETLAQMDVVIASVHTLFNQPIEQMTARVLAPLENPTSKSSATHRTQAPPARRLSNRHAPDIPRRRRQLGSHGAQRQPQPPRPMRPRLRMAKEAGCKIVINTDAHHTTEMENMKYGVRQLRRAWLTKEDVLNTLPAKEFLTALRPKP